MQRARSQLTPSFRARHAGRTRGLPAVPRSTGTHPALPGFNLTAEISHASACHPDPDPPPSLGSRGVQNSKPSKAFSKKKKFKIKFSYLRWKEKVTTYITYSRLRSLFSLSHPLSVQPWDRRTWGSHHTPTSWGHLGQPFSKPQIYSLYPGFISFEGHRFGVHHRHPSHRSYTNNFRAGVHMEMQVIPPGLNFPEVVWASRRWSSTPSLHLRLMICVNTGDSWGLLLPCASSAR